MYQQDLVGRPVRTEEEVRGLIQQLDLEPLKVKLMDTEEGEGWTLQEADEVEEWYKRCLLLAYKYPDKPIVPSKAVDTFWHQHILDTHKYAEDCERIFGYFLRHFPYFGMRGEEDASNLQAAFDESNALFGREFGEAPTSMQIRGSSKCDSCGKGSCGHGCRWCGKCKGVVSNPLMFDVRPRPVRV